MSERLNDWQSTANNEAHLLAVVSVAPDKRIACEQPGCGHGVYAAIHVVLNESQLLALGSTCYQKRYGSAGLGLPRFGGAGGRQLTNEEWGQLTQNRIMMGTSHFWDINED